VKYPASVLNFTIFRLCAKKLVAPGLRVYDLVWDLFLASPSMIVAFSFLAPTTHSSVKLTRWIFLTCEGLFNQTNPHEFVGDAPLFAAFSGCFRFSPAPFPPFCFKGAFIDQKTPFFFFLSFS